MNNPYQPPQTRLQEAPEPPEQGSLGTGMLWGLGPVLLGGLLALLIGQPRSVAHGWFLASLFQWLLALPLVLILRSRWSLHRTARGVWLLPAALSASWLLYWSGSILF